MRTILTVDGNSLFHRAYHAYGPHPGKEAEAHWAVNGFFSLLGAILERVKPDLLLVGLDSETSQRKTEYPDYKSTRPEKDPQVQVQLHKLERTLGELGVWTLKPEGLEADDVSAACARAAKQTGDRCVIATSDRDSFALVAKNVDVLRLVNGGIEQAVLVTERNMLEKTGVQAGQYLDYAALRGDKSDNLPGVEGFGEKSAAKLLAAFPNVGWAYEDLKTGGDQVAKVIGVSLSRKLEEGEKAFLLTRNMMKGRAVELGPLAQGQFKGVDVHAVFEREGLHPSTRLLRSFGAESRQEPEGGQREPRPPEAVEVTVEVEAKAEETDQEPRTETLGEGLYRQGTYFIPNPRPARSLL